MSKFEIEIPTQIKSVLCELHKAGYEAFIVGGCVRDTLLGKEPHDWDITTSAIPNDIQNVFSDYQQLHTGIKHGTVMVVIDSELVEITTYRIDGDYSDGRRPDRVSFTTNIIEDLARRDYTINACAATDTLLIDPFGGKDDITNQLIRCVGNAIQRFTEDALRILRGIRFASVLNFKIEENTKEAMFECKNLLRNVSQERITMEFCKMLLGINVKNTFLEFHEIFACVMPEIEDIIEFKQSNKYHLFEGSLKAVESIEKDIILRVTMFFHGIEKLRFYSKGEKEIDYFQDYETTVSLIENGLHRMRFSTADIRTIIELIRYWDTKIENNSKDIKKLLGKIGETQLRRLLKVKRAEIMAQNLIFENDKLENISNIEQILNDVISQKCCFTLRDLEINGEDLIQLGIPKGKNIGLILNHLLEMVLNEEIDNNKKALLGKAKALL